MQRSWSRWVLSLGLATGLTGAAGCGQGVLAGADDYLWLPLIVGGEDVGTALIDTGGDYELLLRETYGLKLVGTAEISVFTGTEVVGVTEAVAYQAGGVAGVADFALVGSSICDCNAVGHEFFRQTGTVLAVDFARDRVDLLTAAESGEATIAFASPPQELAGFDGALLPIRVRVGSVTHLLIGVLDTGALQTVVQRSALATPVSALASYARGTVEHDQLGAVELSLGLYDSPGLPDVIIGVDLMRRWADEWYFVFDEAGGQVTVNGRLAVAGEDEGSAQ